MSTVGDAGASCQPDERSAAHLAGSPSLDQPHHSTREACERSEHHPRRVSEVSASGTERSEAARPRGWSRSAAQRSGVQGAESSESRCFRTGTICARTVCAVRRGRERRPRRASMSIVAGATDTTNGTVCRRPRTAVAPAPPPSREGDVAGTRRSTLALKTSCGMRPAEARSRAHEALVCERLSASCLSADQRA